MPVSADNTTIPLKRIQKLWLVAHSIPVIMIVFALIYSITVNPNIIGWSIFQFLLVFLLIVGLVALINQASKCLRDLLSGVALIEEDELQRLWHSDERNNILYGQFVRLGKLRMTGQAYRRGVLGEHYQVYYSPASRIVWSLESSK
ncbi:MAG: hypothetical protein H0X30_13680 [Anaerolineae bacterium]|nr:hypothetical protein [Anaerolineae bacterium]